jgi:transposase-like protein
VSILKRCRFPVEIILLCLRWYCKYGISYRDLAEMAPCRTDEQVGNRSWLA